MTEIISAAASLDDLTAQIKLKLVENQVLANTFNRNINQNCFKIGEWLKQAKLIVPVKQCVKQWQKWLDGNFGMTKQAAGNYIRVAEKFGKVKNVFHFEEFQFAALIELSRMTPAELQDFFAEQEHNGVDLAKLSIRNLSKIIKQWKNPTQDIQPTTIDIDAEIKNAPADSSPLKLPPPSFHIIPASLQAAADSAQIKIEMNFGRAFQLPDADIFISPLNLSTLQKYSSIAASVIFTKMDFVRSDGAVKKRQCCIWFFGGNSENFSNYFSQFGEVINLQTQKSPLISAGKHFQ